LSEPIEAQIGLFKTECISFPRCGHHILERLLHGYFEDRLHYCDIYEEPGKSLDRDPTTNFQKNHDFALDTALDQNRQYLVLVRDPREALISWFRLSVRNGEREYTYKAWQKFASEGWAYWGGFFDKWVVAPVPKRLIIDYRELTEAPAATLSRVVEFLSHRPACIDACRGLVTFAEKIDRSSPAELFSFGQSSGLEKFPKTGHGWPE
jgi:sulfotransferase family protein